MLEILEASLDAAYQQVSAGNAKAGVEELRNLFRTLPRNLFTPLQEISLSDQIKSVTHYVSEFYSICPDQNLFDALVICINEFEINPKNWQCRMATTSSYIDPNAGEESFDLFLSLLDFRWNFPPLKLINDPAEAIFEQYLNLSGMQRRDLSAFWELACHYMKLNFFDLGEAAFTSFLNSGKLATGTTLHTLVYIEGDELFYEPKRKINV